MTNGRTFRLLGEEPLAKAALSLLQAEGFDPREEFHPLARRLGQEPKPLGTSLAARFGLIYIQDRSSMLPPLALDPPEGASLLDMCAAPGGKTGLAAQLVGPGGHVFGVEPGTGRMGIMRNNLRRLGLVQASTVLASSEKLPFADESFTHILLDPPCSGWGTEDKHPGISDLWTGQKVKPLIRLQKKLLRQAARLLAPGGRLLYSTCTTNPDEDEHQAAWAAEELGLVPVPLAPFADFTFENMDAPATLKVAPGTLKVAPESAGQGFFLAAFHAPGDGGEQFEAGEDWPSGEELGLPGTRLDPESLSGAEHMDWAALPEGEVWDFGGRVFFLHAHALRQAAGRMRWQGAPLGRLRDGQFRPDGFCRALLPAEPDAGALDVDDPAELSRLLEGQGAPENGPGKEGEAVGLYYRGAGLGWLVRRSGRLLWPEKG